MRILGIDPGLQTTGFGVVDVDGHALRYVGSGTIQTTHLPRGDLPARLKVLFDGIAEVRERYEPDEAAVEIVFVNTNPQSTLLLGQARGAAITALVSCGLQVAEYTAVGMLTPVLTTVLARAIVSPIEKLSEAARALGRAHQAGMVNALSRVSTREAAV